MLFLQVLLDFLKFLNWFLRYLSLIYDLVFSLRNQKLVCLSFSQTLLKLHLCLLEPRLFIREHGPLVVQLALQIFNSLLMPLVSSGEIVLRLLNLRVHIFLAEIKLDNFPLKIRQFQILFIFLSLQDLIIFFLNFELLDSWILKLIEILVTDLEL